MQDVLRGNLVPGTCGVRGGNRVGSGEVPVGE